MRPSILYFDNAATTPLDEEVFEAMLPYLKEHFGNPSAIHSMGRQTRSAIEKTRKVIAQHLNVSPSEIFFTSGATEANNMALLGAVRDLGVKRIISSPTEHHCVLHTLEHLAQAWNVEVKTLPLSEWGRVDLAVLEEWITSDENRVPTLVSLMHANNEIGAMLPFKKISQLCTENGIYLHSDTVQTFGHYTFDLQRTPVDFLSASAHKFHGPKGVGFLYINSRLHISPMIFGGSQERNMRAGTENVAGIVGLGKAVEVAYTHLEEDREYVTALRNYLAEQLEQRFPQLIFNTDWKNSSLYTVLNVAFPPVYKTDLLLMNLDIAGICASGGSACSSGVEQRSHVLQAINVPTDCVAVRFSFSKKNTREQVDELLQRLENILQ